MSSNFLSRLGRSQEGSFAFEFAIALPVLVTLMLGVLQFGMALHAGGAMRNAMGAGLRLAKVDTESTADDVYQETRDQFVGVDHDGIKKLTFTSGTDANGVSWAKLEMQYQMDLLLPFAPIPPIVLTEEKQVYLQEAV